MKFSPTLSAYLSKTYIINFLFLLIGLLLIVYLFDTVELIRRAEKRTDIPLSLVLQMGLLKLPDVGQKLLPFAILFSAMYTFWQLTKRSELIVVRSAGFSIWQFMAPIALIAFAAGLFQITIINPMGALLVGKFKEMEHTYLSREENQIALFNEGLWMRQVINPAKRDTQTDYDYVIVHARSINPTNWELQHVTALHFDKNDQFIKRADAPKAYLKNENWSLQNAQLNYIDKQPEQLDLYKIPTSLTTNDIEDSFASTASMSFWNLPSYIKTLEKTGFNATPLKVYHQSLISQPILFVAMIILAATVSMRPPRANGTIIIISLGIGIGFAIFFLSSFLQAMGSSNQIPTVLAAWSAPLIALLFGIGTILHQEDG